MKKKPSIHLCSLLFILGLACGAISAHAQGPGGPGGPGGGGSAGMGRVPPGGPGGPDGMDMMAALVRALNLTNAQKAQVQPVVDATTSQMKTIREDAATKSDAVLQSAEAQIKPLLTPYQQQVLASLDKAARPCGRTRIPAIPEADQPVVKLSVRETFFA